MEASEQGQENPVTDHVGEPEAQDANPEAGLPPTTGEQGDWLEQDPANIGRQADGTVRMSAPPPHAQSGVPLAQDREAGVEAGEKGPQSPDLVPGAPGGRVPPEEAAGEGQGEGAAPAGSA